ncbi:NAD(P)H-dependent oxidoreductase [Paraburkholderia sp. HD33-4]|uniref:NAD(P)H-dependent oxidoreductase n=1 Tax=Paraburkholderia sp. HD33-4 TaxID=2883242 RepID=UPI001F165136|nr:NAD(P)H-dependent oxidoreductase [Paraburkholderia sp. HD33-4]
MNKKTLVILGHPNLTVSRISAEFARQLADYPVTLHELCKSHEHFQFNVEREQALLTSHQRIVFLFPPLPVLSASILDDASRIKRLKPPARSFSALRATATKS